MPKAEQSLNELLHEIRRVEKSREVLTEKKIRSIYKQLLKELNHFLADEYLKYSREGILTVAILQEKSRYAKFLEEIEANVNTLTPEITSTIRKTVEGTYTACYKGMSEAVLNAKDTKSALNFLKDLEVRPEVMKRAIENPISGLTLPDILEKNRKEVIYDIKQQVNISLMNGDRYETTAKKVAEKLDFSYGKATNIVRTETHRVTESGFMDCAKGISESLEDSEFVYAAIWHNMNDERVRPQHRYHTKSGWKTSKSRNGADHQKMEGKIIQVGDKFQLEPNVYAECPGNSGTARNDCRCRCFLEYDLMTIEEFVEKGGKLLDKSEENGIISLEGVKNMGINAIELPIEQKHTGKGNPNAVLTFGVDLNNRQKKLLESLPEFDSRVIVSKKSVNMTDLAVLTSQTGHEFAMFTKGKERLIIRGNAYSVNINVESAKALAKDGYRWSGHTHPGIDFNCLISSPGDKSVLECFGHKTSVIYNSKGQFATFEKEE